MPPDVANELAELRQKIDQIYASVEKTRKYFFWTLVVSLLVIVLPLIGLLFAIPSFLSLYTDTAQNLGL